MLPVLAAPPTTTTPVVAVVLGKSSVGVALAVVKSYVDVPAYALPARSRTLPELNTTK